MPDTPDVVSEIKQMFPNISELSKSVAAVPGVTADFASGGGNESATLRPAGETLPVDERKVALLADGRRALEKIDSGLEETLTPDDKRGLEAIILLVGRPALLIQENRFFDPPSEWQVLQQRRDRIQESIPRVGRIELAGHPDLDWAGTGSLVGPRTVMTNRHVALEFARSAGERWEFITGRSSAVDFVEELGATTSLEFRVEEIIGIHDELDLALLRVGEAGTGGRGLPEPLSVAATAPDPVERRNVYVVGYPAWDGRRNDPEPMRRIFADIYNVKRLQPGTIRTFDPDAREFTHDCSTLGGNSGSPVFDLDSHQVLGLHFGGRYQQANYAVALWTLTEDPLMRRGEVNFR